MTSDKPSKFSHLPLSTTGPIDCAVTGSVLLNTPYLNKGSAFPADERRQFQLTGMLPESVQTLEQQAHRAYEQYSSRPGSLAKNTFLQSLKYQNEVLFYKLLQNHIKEMYGIVYTPTEGDAIQNYSSLFRRPEGCFLNIHDRDRILADLSQWGNSEDIDYIVVTDGEEILGIGDQGVGGILISSAKLALTTLCAGIHPSRTLPVVLDCGTDNQALLDDEIYLGLRQKRIRGAAYDEFVDTFVEAARKLYPKAYIHFEDFGLTNARRILDKYRPRISCFNDDIQGTGCVTLAAILAGLKTSGQKLADVRMVIFGAGTAGVGIADQVRDAISAEAQISHAEASKQIWLVDKRGLVTAEKDPSDAQRTYVKDDSAWDQGSADLMSVVRAVRPNILIGTSTVPGAFTEDIVRAMHQHAPHPIILPLSNPTRLHEARPADLLSWTDGQALVATGSPFDPVSGPWGPDGCNVTIEVAECNNAVVFPGIGLGCVICRASLLTDRMIFAAVRGVAAKSPRHGSGTAPLLPDVVDVREVSVRVAREVILAAVDEGVATEEDVPAETGELDEWIREQMWDPVYRKLRLVDMEGATRLARGELRQVGTVKRT